MKFLISLIFLTQITYASFQKEFNSERYQIFPDQITTSEINKDSFSSKINEILPIFIKESLAQNRIIVQNPMWETPYFSAWAKKQNESIYMINFWGGMARIPGMLTETWEFIICHEIGHIIGGHPYHQKVTDSLWASSEGQADHFAVVSCLPKFYRSQTQLLEPLDLYPYEVSLCEEKYSKEEDKIICKKILRAGRGFVDINSYLNPDIAKADFFSNEIEAEKTIFDSYPSMQCRFDIFKTASQCLQDKNCQRNDCWYKELSISQPR